MKAWPRAAGGDVVNVVLSGLAFSGQFDGFLMLAERIWCRIDAWECMGMHAICCALDGGYG